MGEHQENSKEVRAPLIIERWVRFRPKPGITIGENRYIKKNTGHVYSSK